MPTPPDFENALFPTDISESLQGGPGWMTTIVRTGSGSEQRVIHWEEPLGRWTVTYGQRSPIQMAVVRAFYNARKGPGIGFLFKAWDNFQSGPPADMVRISDTQYQLVQRNVSGEVEQVKTIFAPAPETVHIFIGGEEVTDGFTVDRLTGVVTFADPPGGTPQATFEFYIPVRFASDLMNVQLDNVYSQSWTFDLEEIRGR